METNKMEISGDLNFFCSGYSFVIRLKNKTLQGMFNEAQRIIAKKGKVGVQRITLNYYILFAPVPSYSGDCKTSNFVLFDRKEEEERNLIYNVFGN